MIAYIIDMEFVWGFQSRIVGLSKTSPSFYYPPPTTFLGSLAESISKKENLGENKGRDVIPSLSENILAIGLRPLNCVPLRYEDINRVVVIRKGTDLFPNPLTEEGKKRLFDSPGRGKTVLASIDDDPPKIRWFLVFRTDSIKIGDKETELLEEHFWSIHRLGSKESRVSVIEVKKTGNLDLIKGKRVITNYSFPINEEVRPLSVKQERWVGEVYVDPYRLRSYDEADNPVINYVQGRKLSLFMVPILVVGPPEYVVEAVGKTVAYKVKEDVILGWSN